jgi:hypothetical protein
MRKSIWMMGLVAALGLSGSVARADDEYAPEGQMEGQYAQDDGQDNAWQNSDPNAQENQQYQQGYQGDEGGEGTYTSPEDTEAQQQAQVSLSTFQEQLGTYGGWEYDNSYGQVFYPTVQTGWRPYQYGRWAMTSYGWTWVSDEPFGWATFHYGRWWFNPYRHAWGWVPGYEWAPAWVAWRYGSASIGWAPLYVGYDRWSDDYPVYYDHWVYVPCEHFYGGSVYQYTYPTSYVRTTYYSTHGVSGYVGTTSYGPPTTFVAQHSAVPITPVQVVHAATPVQASSGRSYTGGAVQVFQPASTRVYQPNRAAPSAIRGPGAAPIAHPVARPSEQRPVYTQPGQTPRPTYRPTEQANPGIRPNAPVYQPQQRPQPSQPSQPYRPAYQPPPQRPSQPLGNPRPPMNPTNPQPSQPRFNNPPVMNNPGQPQQPPQQRKQQPAPVHPAPAIKHH